MLRRAQSPPWRGRQPAATRRRHLAQPLQPRRRLPRRPTSAAPSGQRLRLLLSVVRVERRRERRPQRVQHPPASSAASRDAACCRSSGHSRHLESRRSTRDGRRARDGRHRAQPQALEGRGRRRRRRRARGRCAPRAASARRARAAPPTSSWSRSRRGSNREVRLATVNTRRLPRRVASASAAPHIAPRLRPVRPLQAWWRRVRAPADDASAVNVGGLLSGPARRRVRHGGPLGVATRRSADGFRVPWEIGRTRPAVRRSASRGEEAPTFLGAGRRRPL